MGVALHCVFHPLDPGEGPKHNLYAGANINLSGMQVKAHAEQMAAFQLIMDIMSIGPANKEGLLGDYIRPTIKTVMVHTTENDGAHRCGHCFQVLQSVANWIKQDLEEDDIRVVGCRSRKPHDNREVPGGVNYSYEQTWLSHEIYPNYTHQ